MKTLSSELQNKILKELGYTTASKKCGNCVYFKTIKSYYFVDRLFLHSCSVVEPLGYIPVEEFGVCNNHKIKNNG